MRPKNTKTMKKALLLSFFSPRHLLAIVLFIAFIASWQNANSQIRLAVGGSPYVLNAQQFPVNFCSLTGFGVSSFRNDNSYPTATNSGGGPLSNSSFEYTDVTINPVTATAGAFRISENIEQYDVDQMFCAANYVGNAGNSYDFVVDNIAIATIPDVCQATSPAFNLMDYSIPNIGSGTWRVNGTIVGSGIFNPALYAPGTYTVQLTRNYSNGTLVASKTIFVRTPISGVTLADASVCPGASASFPVTPPGTGPFSYQWFESTNGGASYGSALVDAGNYSGSSTSTLNIVSAVNGYFYKCRVSGPCNSVESNPGRITYFSQVAITSSPSNSTANCIGSSTSFTATGTPRNGSLLYQWQESPDGSTGWTNAATNGSFYTVANANSSTINLSNIQVAATNRFFRCVLSDACGVSTTNTTSAARLGVFSPVSITSQPTDKAVCVGGNTSFNVTGTPANGAVSYQWQVNPGSGFVNISNGGTYSGATSNQLNLISVNAPLDGSRFRCIVSDACGVSSQAVSSGGLLQITLPVSVSLNPVSQTICSGNNVSFTVSASGSGLNYQWQEDGANLANGGGYSGVTTNTLTISGVAPSLNGKTYRALAIGTCGPVPTTSANLTVNQSVAITSQPTSQSVCPGGNVSFSVAAVGTAPIVYLWERFTGAVWSPVGTNSSSFSISSASALDASTYRVTVSSSCGAPVTSGLVSLTVNTIPTIPTVADVARCGNGSISSLASSTSPSPTFNWYNNLSDVSPVFVGATRVISNLTVTTSQFVSVVSAGCEGARKEVVFTRNAIQNTPIGNALTLCAGQSAYNLENDIGDAVAKGNNFTWSAGATNYSSKTFDPVAVGIGTYTVSYTPPAAAQATPYCYVTNTRTVQVTTGSVAINFSDPLISAGNTVNSCVGNAPITISNFPSVAGGTWSTVTGSGISSSGSTTVFTPDASNFTSSTPNTFRYTVTSGGCSGTKDLLIYVKDNPNVPLVAGLPSVTCPGTALSLTASVTVPGTFTFSWFKSGNPTAFATGSILSYVANGNEDLLVRSVNTSFGCSSSAAPVAVRTPFSSGSISVSKNNLPIGDFVKFTYSQNTAGNTYLWDFGDGGSSTEFSPAYYFYKPGQFSTKLKVTSTLGCSQNTTYDFITVTGTAYNVVTGNEPKGGLGTKEFNVYPIPSSDNLTIEGHKGSVYSIFSMSGALVTKTVAESDDVRLDISALTPGLYRLLINYGYINKSLTIIKE